MIHLFDPQKFATSDASLTYLHGIFGPMNNFIRPNVAYAQGTFQKLLPQMFTTFNTVILAVGALIVVYVTIIGVMNTAHQGQFMGKDWNNLWIPIRTVLGISMLVPTASGYSYIQLIMMWVIIQGIGAANVLWSTVLRTLNGENNSAMSPYAKVTPPSTEGKQAIRDLFKGLVCAQTARLGEGHPNPYTGVNGSSDSGNDNSYFCNVNPGDAACGPLPPFPPPNGERTYKLGPDGACGTLTLCDLSESCKTPGSMACLACSNQILSMALAFNMFAGLGEQFALMDEAYQNFYYSTAEPPERTDPDDDSPPPPQRQPAPKPQFVSDYCAKKNINPCTGANKKMPSPLGDSSSAPSRVVDEIYYPAFKKLAENSGVSDNFIKQLSELYVGNMKKAAESFDAPAQLGGKLGAALDTGWILAGSYYMVLARMNKATQKEASPSVSMSTDSSTSPNSSNSPLYHYRTNLDAASRLLAATTGATSSGESKDTSAIQGPADSTTNDIADTSKGMMQPGPDPLTQLAIGGYAILLAVQVFYIILLVIAVLAGISTISVFVLGTGVDTPVESIWTYLFYFIIPLIWLMLGIMVSVGATLSVYVPMIPYIIFTVGAIGWLFSTIEAMIAGPIVALGILSPSGHHEILGEAKPALMLLFNIFLRPSLMIFGLVAAILLSGVVMNMVNAGFKTVFENLFDFGSTGGGTAAAAMNPLALVFILVSYVTLVITALNKCFASIHLVPEKIIRWIGGHAEGGGGEDQAVGEQKGAVGGASSQAGQGMSSGVKSGAQQTKADKEMRGKSQTTSESAEDKKKP